MVGLVGAQSATLATISVTTTADSGVGSLRQAIADSNATVGVADTITFSITGPGPHTITLASALPAISDPVTIDGTTEPDFVASPIVEINAAGVGISNHGLNITAGNSTIRGLVINRAPLGGAAIRLATLGGNTIEGNYLGTNVAGTARVGNNRAIVLESSTNLIGGDTAAERNVISGSTVENIRVDADGNTIQGNYIGTDATGSTSLALAESPNSNGILLNGADNTIIGGTTFGQGNLISGNGGNGVFVSGNGNIIRGNLIGTNVGGSSAVCNESVGIAIGSSSNSNVIGGVDSGARNVISGNCGSGINLSGSGSVVLGNTIEANLIGTDITGSSAVPNAGAGIKLIDSGGQGTRNTVIGGIGTASANVIAMNGGAGVEVAGTLSRLNTIRSNSIFDNDGLGIDLGPAGPTPNDVPANLDGDTGPNDLQNFPVLNPDLSTTTEVAGELDSAANENYQIDVYSTPTCNENDGEGKTRVASFQVTTDALGHAGFGERPLSPSASGFLTATATDASGNTSEFSACVDVGGGGSADLTVEAIDLTPPPGFPPEHSYTVTVRNAGTATADVSGAAVQGYYSADTTLDEGDSPACGTTMSGTIAAGATMDVPVGCSGAPGPGHNYLLVHVDQNNVVPESDDTNNVGSVALDAGGGSLAGSLSPTGGSFNLTTVGTQDWAVWGFANEGTSTSLAPDVRKTGGTAISALTDIRPTPAPLRGLGQFPAENPFTFAWTDGSGPTSQTGAYAGLQHDGQQGVTGTLNDGFSFTVPADTTTRTLRVYVSVHSGTGRLTASLSDASDESFVNSGLTAPPNGANVGGLYTLTYAAASAEQTLTVEWIESASNTALGNDNVAIYAVALEGPGGGGGEVDPPVLFGAVPDATTPGTLGVAGVWDSGSPEPGQNFDVSFYSVVPPCSPSATKTLLGSAIELVTNDRGIGAFAIAFDPLTEVSVGTLVAATVNGSEISNCVVADRNNTSWPTALEVSADDTDNGFLRTTGQGRWFKVPILPANRVNVTVSNLPADYDLVVFKDIQAKYDELIGGAEPEDGPNLALDDLNKQGADTPVDLFNTSQYNPSSWDPTNWDPNLNTSVYSPTEYSPTEYSPTEYSAAFTAPTEYSPTEYSPTEYSPTEYSPTEYSPTEYSADQFSRDEWATFSPADPRAFSAAQTASLVAVSAGPGTGDESVSVNTWNNTGFFYIRVQGKNGSFDPDSAFSIQVSRDGDLCSEVADLPTSPPAPVSGVKTLILVDSSRMSIGGTLSTKLSTFANRPEVDGAIVDVGSTLSALNGQADGNSDCPYAKNLVAGAIKEIVDAYRADLSYVVVVGGDSVIPFFRYPDPALLGNERLYVPPVKDNTASQASLRLGYVLSDDFLASSDTVSIHGNAFPVPDLAIGRLVETPANIEGMLDAYLLGTTAGVVPTPTSSLTTGYDFLTDSADAIATHFQAGIGGTNNDKLITNQNVSPGVVTIGNTPDRTHSWTATDLRQELLAEDNDLVFLAGHFSANDALAADYKTNVLSTELPGAATNLVNAIVFSAGCHAAYNIVNADATTYTEPLDWAQAFAQKQATLIAGTGYQYGDTDFIAHSERIYTEFARQLRVMPGGVADPVAVGSALLRSKQIFLEKTPGLSALDEKALLEATLFGLPMLSVDLPNGRFTETPEGSVVGSLSGFESGPGADLGLQFFDRGVNPPLTVVPKPLDGPSGTVATSYVSAPDGVAVKPTQPILPLESLNVTAPGVALRGVGFRGGSYQDTPNIRPFTAAPATELRGIHAPFITDVFFPPQPWTTNFFGTLGDGSGATQLHVTPVQHKSNSPEVTRRVFEDVDLRLFYSGNVASFCGNRDAPAPCDPGLTAVTPALSAPPTITGVDTSYAGGVLTFEAHVLGEPVSGIQTVWVTYTVDDGGAGTWQSIDLIQDEDDPTLWTGSLTTGNPGLVAFMVQAVNGVGRVTIDDNLGSFYRHGSIPGPPDPGAPALIATTMTFNPPAPSMVPFSDSFNVTVKVAGPGGSPLQGKVVRVGLGGGLLPATTNASGEATVALRASLTPSTYPLTASFAGDATHAASDVTALVRVVRKPTTLTLSGTVGPAIPLVATLTANTSPPTPLHQRNVVVIIKKAGVTQGVFAGKTDPLGRVEVPQSMLASLSAGTHTIDAYFNGVTGQGALNTPSDDVDYLPSDAHITRELWPFTGFFGLQNPPAFNSVRGGTSVPIKFSLGVNRGLGIFASGYPRMGTINCTTGVATNALTAAQNTGFRFDTANNHYTYDWKTEKSWKGTCRQLVVRFADGTERVLRFRFT